jgi:cell wall-associated NlpC family hydrolase
MPSGLTLISSRRSAPPGWGTSVRRLAVALGLLAAVGWTPLPVTASHLDGPQPGSSPTPTAATTATPVSTTSPGATTHAAASPTAQSQGPLIRPQAPALLGATPPPTPAATPTPGVAPAATANPGGATSPAGGPATATATAGTASGGSAPPPGPTPTLTALTRAGGDDLARNARRFLGAPYAWGGTSPAGFDCSGFVWYVHKLAGRQLPRDVPGQFGAGPRVPRDQLQAGDTVFFQNTYKPGLSHNGIYVGEGRFIHAGDERSGVTTSALTDPYWHTRYVDAARLHEPGSSTGPGARGSP